MIDLTLNILEQCKRSFQDVRANLIEATEALYLIKSEELWKSECSSFGEFCEQELQISQSFASKLLSNWQHYVMDGHLHKDDLVGVDYEKLYLAQRLPTVMIDHFTEKLEKAKRWSRSEIKAELAEKNGEECKHEHTITICAACNKRV